MVCEWTSSYTFDPQCDFDLTFVVCNSLSFVDFCVHFSSDSENTVAIENSCQAVMHVWWVPNNMPLMLLTIMFCHRLFL